MNKTYQDNGRVVMYVCQTFGENAHTRNLERFVKTLYMICDMQYEDLNEFEQKLYEIIVQVPDFDPNYVNIAHNRAPELLEIAKKMI